MRGRVGGRRTPPPSRTVPLLVICALWSVALWSVVCDSVVCGSVALRFVVLMICGFLVSSVFGLNLYGLSPSGAQDFLKGRARAEIFKYSGQLGLKYQPSLSSLPCCGLALPSHIEKNRTRAVKIQMT